MRRRMGWVVLILALLLSACGGDRRATDASGGSGIASTEAAELPEKGAQPGSTSPTPAPAPVTERAATEVDAGPVDVADGVGSVLEQHGGIGAAAAVVGRAGVVALSAAGVRRAGSDTAVEIDDRWHLGSMTKAMTATLAAIVVSQGALGWDTTVDEVFASFAENIHPDLRGTTLVHLLSHRSGIVELTEARDDVWARMWENEGPLVDQRLWISKEALTSNPAGPPVETFRYSNTGYIVAGSMLEQVTGRPWEELMMGELFDPLGMDSCGFGAPATPGETDQPWGHVEGPSGEPVPPGPDADNPPSLGPAGTVHCSIEDWGRFVRFHLEGAGQGTPQLRREDFVRLHGPPALAPDADYGYGWFITSRSWAEGLTLTHEGSNTTFHAVAWLAPRTGRAYLAVTNQGGRAELLDALVGELLE